MQCQPPLLPSCQAVHHSHNSLLEQNYLPPPAKIKHVHYASTNINLGNAYRQQYTSKKNVAPPYSMTFQSKYSKMTTSRFQFKSSTCKYTHYNSTNMSLGNSYYRNKRRTKKNRITIHCSSAKNSKYSGTTTQQKQN